MKNLPSASDILNFTTEKIEKLPTILDCHQIPSGTFARIGHSIAKSSLVFITKNDTIGKNVGAISYINCNQFNGVISEYEYSGTYVKRTNCFGDFWVCISNNLETIAVKDK